MLKIWIRRLVDGVEIDAAIDTSDSIGLAASIVNKSFKKLRFDLDRATNVSYINFYANSNDSDDDDDDNDRVQKAGGEVRPPCSVGFEQVRR